MVKNNRREKDGERVGNTSQPSPSKHYCFTLNNYLDGDFNTFCARFANDKYVIGKEVGECGTPHLQGYVCFDKPKRFTELKKLDVRVHWEKCRNIEASKTYCMKDGNYETNIRMPRPLKFPDMNRKWQIEILELIKKEPDDRTIHWYWEEDGNSGKTTFVKYLKVVHGAIEVPAKSTDAFHAIAKRFEEKVPIDIVLCDIPRSSSKFINYGAIEKIKNGNVVSGKYEGCDCVFACPHVIIFANEPPDLRELSYDRWVVQKIKKEQDHVASTEGPRSLSEQDIV